MTITTGRVPSDTRLTIHYLAHSAWLVETARRFILLDYGVLPARDESAAAKLSQGCLDLVSLWPDWLGATKNRSLSLLPTGIATTIIRACTSGWQTCPDRVISLSWASIRLIRAL